MQNPMQIKAKFSLYFPSLKYYEIFSPVCAKTLKVQSRKMLNFEWGAKMVLSSAGCEMEMFELADESDYERRFV